MYGFVWFMDSKQTKISLSTLQLEGKVRGVLVLMLIDNSTSHDFISPQVALIF